MEMMEDTFNLEGDVSNANEDVFNYQLNNKALEFDQEDDFYLRKDEFSRKQQEIDWKQDEFNQEKQQFNPKEDEYNQKEHELNQDDQAFIQKEGDLNQIDQGYNYIFNSTEESSLLSTHCVGEHCHDDRQNISSQMKDGETVVHNECEEQDLPIGHAGLNGNQEMSLSSNECVSNQIVCLADTSQLDQSQIVLTGNSTESQLILIKQEPVEAYEENEQMFTTLQSEIENDNMNMEMTAQFINTNLIIKEEIMDAFKEYEITNFSESGILAKTSATISNNARPVTKGKSKIVKNKQAKHAKPTKINNKSKKLTVKIPQKNSSPQTKAQQKCKKEKKRKTDSNSDESMKYSNKNLKKELKTVKPCKNLSAKMKKTGPNKKSSNNQKSMTKSKESNYTLKGIQDGISDENMKIVQDIKQNFDNEFRFNVANSNNQITSTSVHNRLDHESLGDVTIKTEQGIEPQMTFEPGSNITNMEEQTGMDMVNSGQESGQVMRIEEIHNCYQCHKQFKNKCSLTRHQKSHLPPQFKCAVCKREFTDKWDYTRHLKIHDEGSKHVCRECGKKFQSESSLQIHEIRHGGNPRHLCDVCGKGFYSEHHLKAHMVVHSEILPYMCPTCSKAFKYKKNLKHHVEFSCGKKEKDAVKKQEEFECGTCSKKFKLRRYLVQHYSQHNDPLYMCDVCGKCFKWKTTLNNHRRSCKIKLKTLCDMN